MREFVGQSNVRGISDTVYPYTALNFPNPMLAGSRCHRSQPYWSHKSGQGYGGASFE
jgi:hypothetical protein